MSNKRPKHLRQLPHPGKKALRGQPLNSFGEVKQRLHLIITPTSIEILNSVAKNLQLPRGVLLEYLIRSPDFQSIIENLIP